MRTAEGPLQDLAGHLDSTGGTVRLPFDPREVVENLRRELYVDGASGSGAFSRSRTTIRSAYYAVRPLLPVAVRRHLQKLALRDWKTLRFPQWPLDASVDSILRRVLASLIKCSGREKLPFIWFWPDGYRGSVLMTHDVETAAGLNFCPELLKLDASFGFEASFLLIPEGRYTVSRGMLDEITSAGFEVGVHGLNHDGRLFSDRDEFLRRAAAINRYALEFGARGFRSPVMYRNLDWLDSLDLDYDMSVPNVAHLDPQRGGCCTVMPYFLGDLLEVPVTTTQDYTLFHILGTKDIDLWREQVRLVSEMSGMLSFIIHPDYVIAERGRNLFKALLEHLSEVCEERHLWRALPREVNDWWRARQKMTLVEENGRWEIRGDGLGPRARRPRRPERRRRRRVV